MTTAAIRATYGTLEHRLTERSRDRLATIQPELGRVYCFHLAGNWGTPAARVELARHQRVYSYLIRRSDREYRAMHHREHIQRGEVGRYLWCQECQQSWSYTE